MALRPKLSHMYSDSSACDSGQSTSSLLLSKIKASVICTLVTVSSAWCILSILSCTRLSCGSRSFEVCCRVEPSFLIVSRLCVFLTLLGPWPFLTKTTSDCSNLIACLFEALVSSYSFKRTFVLMIFVRAWWTIFARKSFLSSFCSLCRFCSSSCTSRRFPSASS